MDSCHNVQLLLGIPDHLEQLSHNLPKNYFDKMLFKLTEHSEIFTKSIENWDIYFFSICKKQKKCEKKLVVSGFRELLVVRTTDV